MKGGKRDSVEQWQREEIECFLKSTKCCIADWSVKGG